MEFITLRKNDPEFMRYLTGKFSPSIRALPYYSNDINLNSEQITFKLIPLENLSRPLWLDAFNSLGLGRLVVSLLPALTGFAVSGSRDLISFLLISMCLVTFHFAISLFNDYHDYVLGVDRVDETNPRNPLKKGWFRAIDFLNWGWAALFVCTVSFVFLYWRAPHVLWLCAPGALIGLELGLNVFGIKYIGFSELIFFIFLGPLLMTGVEWTLTKQWTWAEIYLGIFWGLCAVQYVFLKQLRNIFSDSKAKINTLSIKFGFDRSKLFYSVLTLLALLPLTMWIYLMNNPSLYVLVVVYALLSASNIYFVMRSKSFLSSHLAYAQTQLQMRYLIIGLSICTLYWVY